MEKQKIILVCDECLARNYTVTKKRSATQKLQLNKYCKQCDKHTLHIETR